MRVRAEAETNYCSESGLVPPLYLLPSEGKAVSSLTATGAWRAAAGRAPPRGAAPRAPPRPPRPPRAGRSVLVRGGRAGEANWPSNSMKTFSLRAFSLAAGALSAVFLPAKNDSDSPRWKTLPSTASASTARASFLASSPPRVAFSAKYCSRVFELSSSSTSTSSASTAGATASAASATPWSAATTSQLEYSWKKTSYLLTGQLSLALGVVVRLGGGGLLVTTSGGGTTLGTTPSLALGAAGASSAGSARARASVRAVLAGALGVAVTALVVLLRGSCRVM